MIFFWLIPLAQGLYFWITFHSPPLLSGKRILDLGHMNNTGPTLGHIWVVSLIQRDGLSQIPDWLPRLPYPIQYKSNLQRWLYFHPPLIWAWPCDSLWPVGCAYAFGLSSLAAGRASCHVNNSGLASYRRPQAFEWDRPKLVHLAPFKSAQNPSCPTESWEIISVCLF